jgi:hypothetical protein
MERKTGVGAAHCAAYARVATSPFSVWQCKIGLVFGQYCYHVGFIGADVAVFIEPPPEYILFAEVGSCRVYYRSRLD